MKETAIEAYLDTLRKFPQLKHAEVVSLFQKLESDNEDKKTRDRLITSNLRLVVSIAKQFKNHNLPIEDLIQEGNIGLMKAIKRFDWQRGFRFSTYATWWIRQAIGQHVLKRKRTVRLPAHAATVQRKIIQVSEDYKNKFGVEPALEELTELIDASETVIKATLHSGRGTISLSQPMRVNTTTNSSDTFGDRLIDENPAINPFNNVSEKELINITMDVIDRLSAKEAAIIRLRFGLVEENKEKYPITKGELARIKKGQGLS